MSSIASQPAPQEQRESAAEAVAGVMARFDLILDILGRLNRSDVPAPGDDDLRHGCERALTTMLAKLARMKPAPPGKASKAEKQVRRLFQTEAAGEVIDRDQFERLEQLVNRILGED
jgi:hypothetical protein